MKHRIQACGCETDRRAYLARPDKTPTGRGAHLHCLNIFCISCNVSLRDGRLWLIRIWNLFFSISVFIAEGMTLQQPRKCTWLFLLMLPWCGHVRNIACAIFATFCVYSLSPLSAQQFFLLFVFAKILSSSRLADLWNFSHLDVYMITILVHFLLIPPFLHHQALVIHCTYLDGGTWGVASPCTHPAAVLDLLFSTQPST